MTLADTAKLVVQLNLDDRLSPGIGRVNRSLAGLNRGMGQVGRGAGQVAAGLGRVGLIAGTVAVSGIAAAVKVAGDFEAQLNTINTIVKLSDDQLKTLGEGIRQTFRETGQPLEDLTAAYYDLLSAGVKVEDAQSVLNTSVKLGIGGLATTEEAVNLLTTAINAYGLNASGATKAADIFAAAVRDGKVTVAEISSSFADVAPLAAQYGIKLEEIGAAYATLTARGVPAAEVGTQFNRAIIEGLKPGGDLVKVLKGLGGSFEDLIRKKGLVATLQDIRVEAEKQGIPFQDLFGRIEAYKFALATTGPNQAKFLQELEAMGGAAGEVNAQFAERQQGLNFQLGKLKALAQDAGITIGNALLPKLTPLIAKLNDFIQANQGKIADFGKKLAEGFQNFADRAGKADFSGLISGLKLLGEVGKKVVDIFLSLPSGVQAAIVTGVALNKLSGGLIGSGAGNIAGGIIKIVWDRFGARGSSPVNPLWVQAVGGIGAVPGAPVVGGGIGGIIKTFLGVTSAVVLGGLIGDAIARPVYDAAVKPALDFETGIINEVIVKQNPAEITRAIRDVEGALQQLDEARFPGGFDLGPISGLLTLLSTKERDILLAQLATLKDQLGVARASAAANIPTSAKLREAGPMGKPKAIPDTAMNPGGTAVKLPNTAMSALTNTPIAVNKLPPILTRNETASKLVAQRVQDSKFSLMASLASIRNSVDQKQFSAKVPVSVTVNTYVSGTMFAKQHSVTEVASGVRRNTLPS